MLQIDLIRLFSDGFCTGMVSCASRRISAAMRHWPCIAIQANQNEMHGGQSVPNFDYAMAPGVRKTFRKSYFKALGQYFEVSHGMRREDAKALAAAARESIETKPDLENGDAFGEALAAWLPPHQRDNGFETISETGSPPGA